MTRKSTPVRKYSGAAPVAALVLLAMPLSACSNRSAESSAELAGKPFRVDPARNELTITRDSQIEWNGQRASEAELAALLRQTRELTPEPELSFIPDSGASYDLSAKVLHIVKDSGVTKFGFVGNEQYASPEKPTD